MIINGNLKLNDCSHLISLGGLKEVKGNLYIGSSSIESLGNLKKVHGNLYASHLQNLTSCGHLEEVLGDLSFYGCEFLQDLGKIEKVNELITLSYSMVTKKYVEKYKPNLYKHCKW